MKNNERDSNSPRTYVKGRKTKKWDHSRKCHIIVTANDINSQRPHMNNTEGDLNSPRPHMNDTEGNLNSPGPHRKDTTKAPREEYRD